MGFHEKSALACLISIGVVYVPYFAVVFRSPMAALGLFWIAAAALVVLLAAFHIANGLATRTIRTTGNVPNLDELDQRIELQAAKWAGFTLACAVVTWVMIVMHWLPISGHELAGFATPIGSTPTPSHFAIPVVRAMATVHWLFAGFVIANIAYYGGIVLGYRRIAGA